MNKYFDKTIFTNPFTEYLKWVLNKYTYQINNWGKHLRIGYKSRIASTVFGKFNWIGQNVKINNSTIGDYTYISNDCSISYCDIGKFCSIGRNVNIAPGMHPTSIFVSTHPSTYGNPSNLLQNFVNEYKFTSSARVTIGNDVWIGINVVIIDGISIGNGAIIAANSVVTKNVSDYEVVGGVPSKLIKKRFEINQIDFLLKTKWWEKDNKWIKENISKFWSIEDFLNNYNDR